MIVLPLLVAAPVAAVGGYAAWSAGGAAADAWAAFWARLDLAALVAFVILCAVGVAGLWLVIGAAERSGALKVLPRTWERTVGRALDSIDRTVGGLGSLVGEALKAVVMFIPNLLVVA